MYKDSFGFLALSPNCIATKIVSTHTHSFLILHCVWEQCLIWCFLISFWSGAVLDCSTFRSASFLAHVRAYLCDVWNVCSGLLFHLRTFYTRIEWLISVTITKQCTMCTIPYSGKFLHYKFLWISWIDCHSWEYFPQTFCYIMLPYAYTLWGKLYMQDFFTNF